MKLLLSLVAAASALEGSVFFTSLPARELVRLDCASGSCGPPVTLATGLESYGGLLPWETRLVVALNSQQVVHMDPWCSECPMKLLVDVKKAIGSEGFNVRGLTWCQKGLFIVFSGKTFSGLLRCDACTMEEECTEKCSVVDGLVPGKGRQQLSEFAASVSCWKDQTVLVADNSNFRLQAVPANCTEEDCKVDTFAWNLLWPLGVLVVDEKVLVTLDDSIVSLKDGIRRNFSSKGDNGFLCQGDGRILVASGHDGNVVSYDPSCEENCSATVVWNSTKTSKAATAIAYMRKTSALMV